jgi:hypothetical protein
MKNKNTPDCDLCSACREHTDFSCCHEFQDSNGEHCADDCNGKMLSDCCGAPAYYSPTFKEVFELMFSSAFECGDFKPLDLPNLKGRA